MERFPTGFDAWCQAPGPPDGWQGIAFEQFRERESSRFPDRARTEIIQAFETVVTAPGKYWKIVGIDSRLRENRFDLQFRKEGLIRPDMLKVDSTDIWHLEVSGESSRLTVSGATIRSATLVVVSSEGPFQFIDCNIGRLLFTADRKVNVEMTDCWVGFLQLNPTCLKNFKITGGGSRTSIARPLTRIIHLSAMYRSRGRFSLFQRRKSLSLKALRRTEVCIRTS